jgi:hypothetical protein
MERCSSCCKNGEEWQQETSSNEGFKRLRRRRDDCADADAKATYEFEHSTFSPIGNPDKERAGLY